MDGRRSKLFTPGPVEVPRELVEAAGEVVHHRSAEFRALFGEVRLGLRRLFRTGGEVAVLAASGSGAMEAAAANVISPGDRALVVRSGKYGGRWEELCLAYGAKVDRIDVEAGDAVDPSEVGRRVREDRPEAVFLVHSETSTGALNDVEAVARAVAGRAAVIVDVVSSLGVHAFEMDGWGVGLAVAASQKGLGLPPGLALVALGPEARPWVERARSPRYYFDLRKYVTAAQEDQTPFTAPVTQVAALAAALRKIEPLEENLIRHARLAQATRAGCRALGLEIFPTVPSNAVTVFRVPASLDAGALVRVLDEEFGVRIAEGQGGLKGKILRLGHLGWVGEQDLVRLFEALEGGLRRCRHPFEPGRGVDAVRGALARPAGDGDRGP